MKLRKRDEKRVEERIELNNKIEESTTMLRPQICLIDFKNDAVDSIRDRGFNVTSSSLGNPIKIPNHKTHTKEFCLLNNNIPANIHEYDIIAIDLDDKIPTEFKEAENVHEHVKSNEAAYILVEYPQTLFEPRPLASSILKKQLSNIINRKYILIAFASRWEEQEYSLVSVEASGYRTISKSKVDNYSFTDHFYFMKNLNGKEMEVVSEFEPIKSLLNKNKELFRYEIVFKHPQIWTGSKYVPDKDFIPLLKNNNKEIISYLYLSDDSLVFMFPQMRFKEKLMLPLLQEILPSILPELFPNSTLSSWKNSDEYLLPNHRELENKKNKIKEEYQKQIEKIDRKISENIKTYSFLHSIITETDTNLVDAVAEYLEWLGFEKIRKMDRAGELKEEDLQIEIEKGLLVIEVKGIGGTSKDNECGQISKIKYRRCKERKKFDVSALYIVNHQRYLEPKKRINPPFTKEQITDAQNDERGLLTTWDLFKMYFYIHDGIFKKEDVRKKFIEFGLVNLIPDTIIPLGQVNEVFKNGLVFILNINDITINVGDSLIVYCDDNYYRVVIKNLQLEGEDIKSIDSGQAGFLVDEPVKKNALIFIENRT